MPTIKQQIEFVASHSQMFATPAPQGGVFLYLEAHNGRNWDVCRVHCPTFKSLRAEMGY